MVTRITTPIPRRVGIAWGCLSPAWRCPLSKRTPRLSHASAIRLR